MNGARGPTLSSGVSGGRLTSTWRRYALREPVDKITAAYLALVCTAITVFGRHLEAYLPLSLLHLALFLFTVFAVPFLRGARHPALRFAGDWYPVPTYIFMYCSANLANQLFFRGTFDEFFRRLDRLLFFGIEPSYWLARNIGSPLLHEIVHAFYFSYYLLIPGIGLLYYFNPRARGWFQPFLFSVCFTFYLSYLVFIVLPVYGPQLDRGEDFSGGVFFVPIMDFIYAHAETGGGAFPSSHVAVALVCLLYARRYGRSLFLIALPSVVGLVFATVYCRYHYAVDAIAGLLWGALLYRISQRVYRLLGGDTAPHVPSRNEPPR